MGYAHALSTAKSVQSQETRDSMFHAVVCQAAWDADASRGAEIAKLVKDTLTQIEVDRPKP